ncbi:MAG: hypothetical protein QXR53_02210 [Candidatus Norongarragalinales archaeon]
MEDDEKKAIANSMYVVGRAVNRDVDPGRLSSMPDAQFEKEIDELSNEILHEIGHLKKHYYEEGFKEALKQVRVQGHETQTSLPSALVVQQQPAPQHALPDFSLFESKLSSIDQKLSEFSDRISALEQTALTSSNDEELKQVISENRDLVETLKNRLSEVAVLQSSIEEKLSQSQSPSSELQEKIEGLKAQVDGLGGIISDEGSKINRIESNRRASVRRLERKFKSLEKRLDDFKKVRRQIRKQGKRITTLSEGVVEKTSFKTALKRVKASKLKPSKRKEKRARKPTATVTPKQLVIQSKSVKVVGAPKKKAKPRARKASAKKSAPKQNASKISISAPAATTVEIKKK